MALALKQAAQLNKVIYKYTMLFLCIPGQYRGGYKWYVKWSWITALLFLSGCQCLQLGEAVVVWERFIIDAFFPAKTRKSGSILFDSSFLRFWTTSSFFFGSVGNKASYTGQIMEGSNSKVCLCLRKPPG